MTDCIDRLRLTQPVHFRTLQAPAARGLQVHALGLLSGYICACQERGGGSRARLVEGCELVAHGALREAGERGDERAHIAVQLQAAQLVEALHAHGRLQPLHHLPR